MAKTRKYTLKTVTAAMCTALGVVLPIALHGIPNAGSVLLPMHFPVLLCGLLCGPMYGAFCGVLTPLLSALITSMPGPAYLPSMLCELTLYGLTAGLLMQSIHFRSRWLRLYTSLVGAMLIGRVAYGIMNALLFHAGNYSIYLWLTASFVTSLPGIAAQLLLLPAAATAIEKARSHWLA